MTIPSDEDWEVLVNGQLRAETFATEDEASQFGANLRQGRATGLPSGTTMHANTGDLSMRIEVRHRAGTEASQ